MSGQSDVVTTYYYNDDWQVIGEYKTGMPLRCYYYGNDIDEVLMSYYTDNGTFSGMVTYRLDHLNSPIITIDSSGNLLERYEYSAYGEVDIFTAGVDGTFYTADDTHNLAASTVDNRISFTGRELDILDSGDLRLMYYRNRYYNPTHGRFLTKDPLGTTPYPTKPNAFNVQAQYTDGTNIYQYVTSNPINATDAWGLLGMGLPWDPNPYNPQPAPAVKCDKWRNNGSKYVSSYSAKGIRSVNIIDGLGGLPISGPIGAIIGIIGEIGGKINYPIADVPLVSGGQGYYPGMNCACTTYYKRKCKRDCCPKSIWNYFRERKTIRLRVVQFGSANVYGSEGWCSCYPLSEQERSEIENKLDCTK